MKEDQQNSYRQIFGATSLFGGVQSLNIIISVIRSKFVAVLLEPAGMGIVGLLNSTTGLIAGLTNFGLGVSAVKNVAAAHATVDDERIGTAVGVLRRLVWITGLLGTLLTITLSPWLSKVTFGNRNYTIAFIWISVTLLLDQISSGQTVILRGTRRLKYMARASLLGSVLGVLISVPIYYFYRVDGIVPAIIISSLIALLLSWHFSRKVKICKVEITPKIIVHEGKSMLTMGFMLSLGGLITLGSSYLIRIFISNTGGTGQVGLYNAGFAIINTYVGMIFTALSMDYYPRLAGIAHDNKRSSELVNQQSEIAVLILAPILTIFIIFIQFVVMLLYSAKFLPVNGMIQWAALGMFFKTTSWAVAFILIAKGAAKLYFWNELVAESYLLIFNIIGYKLAGLTGLGISFLIGYLVYTIQVALIARRQYEFRFQSEFVVLFCYQLIHAVACFLIVRFLSAPWSYLLGSVVILSSLYLSYRELDKRMHLKSVWTDFKNRRSK